MHWLILAASCGPEFTSLHLERKNQWENANKFSVLSWYLGLALPGPCSSTRDTWNIETGSDWRFRDAQNLILMPWCLWSWHKRRLCECLVWNTKWSLPPPRKATFAIEDLPCHKIGLTALRGDIVSWKINDSILRVDHKISQLKRIESRFDFLSWNRATRPSHDRLPTWNPTSRNGSRSTTIHNTAQGNEIRYTTALIYQVYCQFVRWQKRDGFLVLCMYSNCPQFSK